MPATNLAYLRIASDGEGGHLPLIRTYYTLVLMLLCASLRTYQGVPGNDALLSL